MSALASRTFHRAPQNTPRRRALTLALATAMTSVVLPTAAQETGAEATATQLDTLVVVGSRMQAKEEIDTRREAVAIVDSLSADEIGAMPDLTIAESLRRITGVTTVYNDDIGQFASIRGSHPDFVPVTINGLTIATTGDHGEGTRKVNLQVIPTNAVQQLQAFKTLSPELDAGALAGLINIVPSSAFDMGQPLVNATLGTSYSTYMDVPDDNRGGRDGVSSPWGRSARLAWAPTFANDTIGLLVTGVYEQRPRTQSNNAIPNRMYYNDAGSITTPDSADWNGIGAPDGFTAHSYTNVFTKHGGTVKLDWRPNERFNASLFGFAYLSDEQETRNSNRIVTLDQHRDQTENTGTANIRAADTQWRFNDFNRDQMGIQGRVEWDLADKGRLSANLGRSKAWYRSDRPFSAFRVQNAGRLSYDLADPGHIFVPDDGGALLDPGKFTNWNVYKDRREANSYVTEAKVDYGFNDGSEDRGWGFSTGLNYRVWDMERDNTATQYARGQVTLEGLAFTPDFDTPGYSWPALWLDADEFWKNVIPGMEIDEETSLYNSLANDYRYREKVLAGYVNGVYATDDFRVSGGLRLDRAEFDAEMASVAGGVVQPGKAFASGSDTEVLPYLNVIWSLSPDFRIKASASKTLGRANPEMIATVENFNDEEFTVSRGNAGIKPRQSTNLDLGMEYYFHQGLGMVTLTGFYKDISDDILNMSWQETIEDETWTVTSPINGEDTTYKGLELGVIHSSFGGLHHALAPLGASVNMMWIDGKSSYIYGEGIHEIDQLQYQSKFAGNAAVFWSFNKGSELRLAVNHQGKYLESFDANPWDTLWIQPLTTVDLTAKWNVSSNLQLRLSGRNIFSKSRGRTIGPNHDMFRAGLEIGSTWFLDMNYRF
ncbi:MULTISPECIES: TonB-dependent receptor [unclassified Luteimonas]